PVPMLELSGVGQGIQTDRRSRQAAFDGEAMRQTSKRLKELRADLERAQQENSSVEADTIQAEIGQLESNLTSATALGGKLRDLNNLFDKLRPMIHGRLATVYKVMRAADPPMKNLADHFERSISCERGSGFVYRPAGAPPPWKFHQQREK